MQYGWWKITPAIFLCKSKKRSKTMTKKFAGVQIAIQTTNQEYEVAQTNQGKRVMKWLRFRMEQLQYASLQEVADAVGINRGNLYRYFTAETRPSIEMLPPLCSALEVSYEELLEALEVTKPSKR
jgi:transcriptional regulator with XRE-family HTH domain